MPKKQYFILSHTKEKNKTTLDNEFNEGYNSEEFVLSDIEKGEWFLNLIVPNNRIRNIKLPTMLKIKLYTNFGTSNEKFDTKLINLDRINKSLMFTSFKI